MDKNIILESNNNIRIGLSWDAKQPTSIRKIRYSSSSYIANIMIFPMWILGLMWSSLVFILTFGNSRNFPEIPNKASLASSNNIYNISDRNKKQDDENIREEYSEYDLDLYCMALRKADDKLIKIGPENHNMIDSEEVFIHSGDENTGQGIYDDEDIIVNLKEAAKHYSKFIIYVASDCSYDFGKYDNNPVLHIVNSKIEKDIIKIEIDAQNDAAQNSYEYIFAMIYEEAGLWKTEVIDKFIQHNDNLLRKN